MTPPQRAFSSMPTAGVGSDGMAKMLPTVPDMDTQIALAAKMIDKRTSTPKGSHSYGSYFLEYSLMAEFNLLLKQKLPGIYCIPSAKSPLVWFGVLFIRQGPYQEGVFRFQVHIPENYPDGDVPKIVFENSVFHPSIDPATHVLNVKQGFHKWKRNVNHIWQILLYTRRVFHKIDTAAALNPEAAQLYEKDTEEFTARARSCVIDWKEQLYLGGDHEDPHYLNFSAYDPVLHGAAREKLKQGASREGGEMDGEVSAAERRSYLATGSLTIFSEDIIKENQNGPKSMPK